MTRLTYAEVSAIEYSDETFLYSLSPAQQSLAAQAVSIFAMYFNWSDYDEYADAIDSLVAGTITALAAPEMANVGMSLLDLWSRFARTNFACAPVFNSSQLFGYYMFPSSAPAINNYYAWDCYLSPGTWTLELIYVRNTANGIATIYLIDTGTDDETILATQDMYGSLALNQAVTTTFTLTSDAPQVVAIQARSKNASSSGYYMLPTMINLRLEL